MNWNAADYQNQFSYVWQHGESLLTQLNPQPGEHILDLGCGTGQLTQQIAASGAIVKGLDSDPAMIAQAQANYPDLRFQVADVADLQRLEPVDAIFSNATLHWVTQAEAAACCMAQSLKPGGRLVCEFGAKGNVHTILSALEQVSDRAGFNFSGPNSSGSNSSAFNPWYFPSLGEYVALLDWVGLDVVYAHIFDRPTPLGKAGLAGWLNMFGQRFFAHLSAEEWAERVSAVEAAVQHQLYQNGEWIADYRRLRVVAIKA